MKGEKILVSSEDLLIDYCDRICGLLKQNSESLLKLTWRLALDKFLSHNNWPQIEGSNNSSTTTTMNSSNQGTLKLTIQARLEARINELKERRKRGIKMIYKREGRLSDFEHGLKTLLARKA